MTNTDSIKFPIYWQGSFYDTSTWYIKINEDKSAIRVVITKGGKDGEVDHYGGHTVLRYTLTFIEDYDSTTIHGLDYRSKNWGERKSSEGQFMGVIQKMGSAIYKIVGDDNG